MKIAVLKGCRSDTGLINPVLKRLKEDKFFEVSVVNLVASDYATSYAKMDWYLKHNTPDLVFIPADRIEMIAGATCCFLYRIPIAHLYGGITNHPLSTVDDIFRHQISLMSEIIFCENYRARKTIHHLFDAIGKDPYEVWVIGNLYTCDWDMDNELVPDTEYDLILWNGYNKDEKKVEKEHDEIMFQIGEGNRYCISIGGNPDSDFVFDSTMSHFSNVPRAKFLGLLSNCKRFITNSSSAYYEAPAFLEPKNIILVGDRNKNRSTKFNLPKGKPDLIITILKNWRGNLNET